MTVTLTNRDRADEYRQRRLERVRSALANVARSARSVRLTVRLEAIRGDTSGNGGGGFVGTHAANVSGKILRTRQPHRSDPNKVLGDAMRAREQAKAEGLKTYQGNPCKHGHTNGLRRTSDGTRIGCIEARRVVRAEAAARRNAVVGTFAAAEPCDVAEGLDPQGALRKLMLRDAAIIRARFHHEDEAEAA